ncbi:MAG: hypothetical protein ABIW30_05595 [Arenimonas sp.]
MFVLTAFLAVLALVLLGVLLEMFRQNRSLWYEAREIRRSVPGLLRDTVVLWSPLALVIVVLAVAANRLAAGAVSLTYRLSTLDEFCEVEGFAGQAIIPCTGMSGALAKNQIRPAGAPADLELFLSQQFRAARQRLLAPSAGELRAMASDLPGLYRSLQPRTVLGLSASPEDDPELVRLKQDLRALLATPTQPAAGLLDIVRFVTERDARVPRMRVLTAMVRARREQLNRAAYGGLSSEEQGRLWLRNRIAHLVAQVPARPDAVTQSALERLQDSATPHPDAVTTAQRGLLSLLAKNESAVADILLRDSTAPKASAALYLALPMSRRCTVAEPDEGLRMRASDFADAAAVRADLSRIVQTNSGSFPCFNTDGMPDKLRLRSLGFRESVRRSIERWHEDMARNSVRRLGGISLLARADATAAAEQLAQAVPSGIELGRNDCAWLHPGNCAANAANAAVEQAYLRARADALSRYREATESATGAAAASLDQRLGGVLLTLDARLAEMHDSADAFAARSFLLSYLLRILGWLALALITIKSFLYVLALELFHSEEGELAIGFRAEHPVEGEYRAATRITIDRDFPHRMITREQLSNSDNNLCLAPWPWSSPLIRILRARYFIFTKGRFLADAEQADAGQPARGMVASAGGGMSIVEWKMRPGEQVVFGYRDFYGASENIRLRSEISLRLSTLLLGRIIFHSAYCADGEGRLLLRASVEDNAQEDIRAVPPERMIAWNRHAQFTIHSSRTPWKTLINGYTLVRKVRPQGGSGRIVVSSADAGSNLGSVRFVRRIVSAIF